MTFGWTSWLNNFRLLTLTFFGPWPQWITVPVRQLYLDNMCGIWDCFYDFLLLKYAPYCCLWLIGHPQRLVWPDTYGLPRLYSIPLDNWYACLFTGFHACMLIKLGIWNGLTIKIILSKNYDRNPVPRYQVGYRANAQQCTHSQNDSDHRWTWHWNIETLFKSVCPLRHKGQVSSFPLYLTVTSGWWPVWPKSLVNHNVWWPPHLADHKYWLNGQYIYYDCGHWSSAQVAPIRSGSYILFNRPH